MTRWIRPTPWGYYWKVVVDPTRNGEEPGMFYGGHFRWTDIVLPGWDKEARKIPCPWPSGTVFENIKTGERVVIKRGRVVKEKGDQHERHSDSGQDRSRRGRSGRAA